MIESNKIVAMYHDGSVVVDEVHVDLESSDIVKFPGFWELHASDKICGATMLISRFGRGVSIEIDKSDETLKIEQSKLTQYIKGTVYMYSEGEENPYPCRINMLSNRVEIIASIDTSIEYDEITFPLLLGNTTIMINCHMDDEHRVWIDTDCTNAHWLWSHAVGDVSYSRRYNMMIDEDQESDYSFTIVPTNGADEVKVNTDTSEENEWQIVEVDCLVPDLERWIVEAGDKPDATLMRADLEMIRGWSDTYIWSSLSTNDFVSINNDPRRSDEIAKKFL